MNKYFILGLFIFISACNTGNSTLYPVNNTPLADGPVSPEIAFSFESIDTNRDNTISISEFKQARHTLILSPGDAQLESEFSKYNTNFELVPSWDRTEHSRWLRDYLSLYGGK